MELNLRVQETINFLSQKVKQKPKIGIILGTGLGSLADKIKVDAKINYEEIPHFPKATAVGHKGVLIFGTIAGKSVVAMEGRFHYYEGYSLKEVTYPVRIMNVLGCKILIVSNASGGMNPNYKKGDIVVIKDHINLMGVNPLIGQNEDKFGPRFPDMSEPYDRNLIKIVELVGQKLGIQTKQGVYVAVSGPNLETPAEYRFLRIIGADLVGMSTVPEVIVARHQGIRVVGLSVVTDIGFPGTPEPLTVEEVIKVAEEAEPYLTMLIEKFIERLEDRTLQ
ncbi:MAG: purine-nucleoside phosphorylase [Planctomycetes bacterium]|nr:purine-nucleoside phosphorylase [Planctomycetota bacterium]